MKNVIKLLSVFAIIAVIFTSCRKDDDNGNNNNPTATGSFKWRENDPNGADKTAAASELRAAYNTIMAFSNADGTGTLFEINLTGSAPGTYDLAASGNSFYFKDMATGSAVTGEVVITSNSGGKASGTFKALTGGSGITRVYGTFTDIPVK